MSLEKKGWIGRLHALNRRVQAMVQQYGMVAVATIFAFSVLNVAAFYFAIRFGFAESEIGAGGTFAAAYIASRATKPLAALAALASTPLVARLVRGRKAQARLP